MIKSKNFLFIVQGLGRGHISQAINLQNLLINQGHKISAVCIGKTKDQVFSEDLIKKFACPVFFFISPSFIMNKKTQRVSLLKTFFQSLVNLNSFINSKKELYNLIEKNKPDYVVNFFDPVAASLNLDRKVIAVGNQYGYLHPDYNFPKGHYFDKFTVKLYTRYLAKNASTIVAFTLKEYPPKNNLISVPPLIKSSPNSKKSNKDFFLVYLFNDMSYDKVRDWADKNPESKIVLHCFRDQEKKLEQYSKNVFFHKIDSKLFASHLENCSGVITQGGFQTLSEALALSKPILMLPIPNHYEQLISATLIENLGGGIISSNFAPESLVSFSKKYNPKKINKWFKHKEKKLLEALLKQS